MKGSTEDFYDIVIYTTPLLISMVTWAITAIILHSLKRNLVRVKDKQLTRRGTSNIKKYSDFDKECNKFKTFNEERMNRGLNLVNNKRLGAAALEIELVDLDSEDQEQNEIPTKDGDCESILNHFDCSEVTIQMPGLQGSFENSPYTVAADISDSGSSIETESIAPSTKKNRNVDVLLNTFSRKDSRRVRDANDSNEVKQEFKYTEGLLAKSLDLEDDSDDGLLRRLDSLRTQIHRTGYVNRM